ncbi:hypothetical protein B0H14DRAFT_2827345 [Mycena olivaceomarginata]|nr:hypothetical protein B0H14DRAFT_2827345 [Mycena olivaceomarginata]
MECDVPVYDLGQSGGGDDAERNSRAMSIGATGRGGDCGTLRRVEFFWICRSAPSFSWFQSLLQGVEAAQADCMGFQGFK